MMLYKSTIAIVCSFDGDTDFFDIVAVVLQGDILTLYLFRVSLDYFLPKSIKLIKENLFTLKKAGSRWYSSETMTDPDYADDLALLANAPSKQNSYSIALSKQREPLACTWMQIKQSIYVLNKKEPSQL